MSKRPSRPVIVAGKTAMIFPYQLEILEAQGLLADTPAVEQEESHGFNLQRNQPKTVTADDPVQAVYDTANNEHREYRFWDAIGGSAEGQITYEHPSRRPSLTVVSAPAQAPEFRPPTSALQKLTNEVAALLKAIETLTAK